MAKKTQSKIEENSPLLPAAVAVILRDELAAAMAHLQKIGRVSAGLPVLEDVLIEVRGRVIRLTRTNLELTLCLEFAGVVHGGDWQVLANARAFGDLVRAVDTEQIELSCLDTGVTVRAGRLTATIRGGNPADFPRLATDEAETLYSLSAGDLCRLFEIGYAASHEDAGSTPLAGLHMAVTAAAVQATATDSLRMARCCVPATGPADVAAWILPAGLLRHVQAVLQRLPADEWVTLRELHGQALFEWRGGTAFVAKMEKFPEVENIIPTSYAVEARVARAALLEMLRIAAPFADGNGGISLDIRPNETGGVITALTTNLGGDQQTDVPALVDGNDIQLMLNRRYLLDAVEALRAEEVRLRFNQNNTPVCVDADGDAWCLIMPMLKC